LFIHLEIFMLFIDLDMRGDVDQPPLTRRTLESTQTGTKKVLSRPPQTLEELSTPPKFTKLKERCRGPFSAHPEWRHFVKSLVGPDVGHSWERRSGPNPRSIAEATPNPRRVAEATPNPRSVVEATPNGRSVELARSMFATNISISHVCILIVML
jgi:hypothetical protein